MPFGNAVGEGFINPGIIVARRVIVSGPDDGVFVCLGTVTPANLIVAVDSQGIIVGLPSGPQIKIGLDAAHAGIVQIDVNDSRFLAGKVNSAVVGSPNYDSLGVIGPASTAAGHGDFVEEAFNSAN